MNDVSDRADIIELFGRYADIADRPDVSIQSLSGVHTDPFTLDFESVNGMAPMTVPLSDYGDALSRTLNRFDATHHCITGHVIVIDGDTAHARAHVRAEHWTRGPDDGSPDRWLVVGFYDNEAVRTEHGWRFRQVTLAATHQERADLSLPSPEQR